MANEDAERNKSRFMARYGTESHINDFVRDGYFSQTLAAIQNPLSTKEHVKMAFSAFVNGTSKMRERLFLAAGERGLLDKDVENHYMARK